MQDTLSAHQTVSDGNGRRFNLCIAAASCQCGSAPRILLSPGWKDHEEEVEGVEKKEEGE